MKTNLKDILLLVFGLVGLYLLFEISQNGRFVKVGDYNILDTRNGKIYFSYQKEKKVPGNPDFYWVLKFEGVK